MKLFKVNYRIVSGGLESSKPFVKMFIADNIQEAHNISHKWANEQKLKIEIVSVEEHEDIKKGGENEN